MINIPSVTVGNNIGDYIEIKAVANSGNPSGIYRVVGISSGYSALIGVEPTKLSISISSSNTAISVGYTQPAVGEIFTVKLRKSGTNQYIASMNGVDFAPFSAFGTFTINQLFRWATESTGAFKGGIYYVEISTNGGVSATRYYDPSASGGTGTVLPDTVNSANNGALVGFTSPACWVFYNGGATTHDGGGPLAVTLPIAGGGFLFAIGGAAAPLDVTISGGGARGLAGGGPVALALAIAGGGVRGLAGGADLPIAVAFTGGGTRSAVGGGSVTVSALISGGGARASVAGGPVGVDLAIAGGGAFLFAGGGGPLPLEFVIVGGGDVLGPGYKPTIRTPAVMVEKLFKSAGVRVAREIRAPYAARVDKVRRAAECRL